MVGPTSSVADVSELHVTGASTGRPWASSSSTSANAITPGRSVLPGTRIAMLYQGKVRQVGTVDEIRLSDDPLVRQFVEGNAEVDLSGAA